MERTKAVFNWSGGKDSAHALWRAIESQRYEIVALLTTVNHDTRRSTMHGIPFPLYRHRPQASAFPSMRSISRPKAIWRIIRQLCRKPSRISKHEV